jgi:hypothetical protein
MSVSAVIGKEMAYKDYDYGRRWRQVRLDISGLSVGANTIPHGLKTTSQGSVTIMRENVLLTSVMACHQSSPGDATNLYYTVDSGPGTTMSVWVVV